MVAALGAGQKQMVEIARAVHAQRPGHHLRRADRDADAGGEAAVLLAGRAAEGARRLDHLHLARAGGGAADRRPHHGAARRRACRDRRHGGVRPRARSCAPWSAARCPTSSTASAQTGKVRPRRREGAERPEPVDGQRGAQHVVLGLRGPDHRRLRPGRLGAHRDGEGRRRRAEARLLPRRRRCGSTDGRCATACRGRPCATASSTSPRTARSKASSRPCRSPRTSTSACWRPAASRIVDRSA